MKRAKSERTKRCGTERKKEEQLHRKDSMRYGNKKGFILGSSPSHRSKESMRTSTSSVVFTQCSL